MSSALRWSSLRFNYYNVEFVCFFQNGISFELKYSVRVLCVMGRVKRYSLHPNVMINFNQFLEPRIFCLIYKRNTKCSQKVNNDILCNIDSQQKIHIRVRPAALSKRITVLHIGQVDVEVTYLQTSVATMNTF